MESYTHIRHEGMKDVYVKCHECLAKTRLTPFRMFQAAARLRCSKCGAIVTEIINITFFKSSKHYLNILHKKMNLNEKIIKSKTSNKSHFKSRGFGVIVKYDLRRRSGFLLTNLEQKEITDYISKYMGNDISHNYYFLEFDFADIDLAIRKNFPKTEITYKRKKVSSSDIDLFGRIVEIEIFRKPMKCQIHKIMEKPIVFSEYRQKYPLGQGTKDALTHFIGGNKLEIAISKLWN